MSIIAGIHRKQTQIYCLDDAVDKNSEARLIDAFVNWINLDEYRFVTKGKTKEGHPAYDVKDLLKLYFYGYLNKTRSSRRLQWLCKTNIEVKWLINGLIPSHTSISTFRKDNGKQFIKVFRAFNKFLRNQDVFDKNTVATDGSKFRAQNSKKNNYNQKKIKQHLDYIDKQTNKFLEDLERNDNEESENTFHNIKKNIAAKLNELQKRREKYESLDQQIQKAHAQGQTQISTTDEDARALPKKMNIVEVSYNIITTVEAKNKFITNFEVTNKHDTYALSTAGRKARIALGLDINHHLIQLADKGFDTGYELKQCADHNIDTIVAPKKRVSPFKSKEFNKDKFIYNKDEDYYSCPQGKILKTNGNYYKRNHGLLRKSYRVKRYVLPFNICNACPHKLDCAGNANISKSKGRYIERSEYQDYVDNNIERVKNNKDLYRKRQQIVEHPYGTIKRQWGYDYTLLKRMKNVSGEFAIIFTVYNLRRAISIFGVQELIKRLNNSLRCIFHLFRGFLKLFNAIFLKKYNSKFRYLFKKPPSTSLKIANIAFFFTQ
jgi:transposase